ncbi:MAG: glycine cleavage system protein GcvH [Anaerolineae bacterium]|nr:glycine cleavage system protein GcvH [Anaerolineae bacterium]
MKYAQSHEYARVEGEIATVGISVFAADELGDIIELMFPEVGMEVKQGDSFMTLESLKSAQDLYAPVSGVVTEVNTALLDNPELVNDDPEGEGWLVRMEITDLTELDDLTDEDPV